MGAILTEAMDWLATHPEVVFLGQGVKDGGTRMSASFKNIHPDRRIEFPVAENLQLGVALGLSLEGFLPVCVFPRWNFLLSAADQLVNHLDRIPLYSDYKPKVIIRVAVGPDSPLDPGHQHTDDFTNGFREMLKNIHIYDWGDSFAAYRRAYGRDGSTIVVEQ
jgi:pyruvate/2-oxoglutarate/acetoin dehydrogenase E1 component